MPTGLNDYPDKAWTRCYELNGVLYVPTYANRAIFAKPGGGSYTEAELRLAGARARLHLLWAR